jgi:DNA mismatch endonuclease, patch repair protein
MSADKDERVDRSETMRRVHGRDTSPELRVRRMLHAAGFRFRLQRQDLPGKPDLVLPRFGIALLVNGCFWHWHGCKRSRMPATNRDYWERKIARNVARDRVNIAALETLGWDVRILWECELTVATNALIAELLARDNLAAARAHCRPIAIESGAAIGP